MSNNRTITTIIRKGLALMAVAVASYAVTCPTTIQVVAQSLRLANIEQLGNSEGEWRCLTTPDANVGRCERQKGHRANGFSCVTSGLFEWNDCSGVVLDD